MSENEGKLYKELTFCQNVKYVVLNIRAVTSE
jgi:hypothetical protein